MIQQKMYTNQNRDRDKPKVKEWHICIAEKVYEVSSQICTSVKFRSLEMPV